MPKSDLIKEKGDLTKLQMKADKERHKMKMMELEYQRESEKIHHDHEMERQRIKSAEIRKTQERKELSRMGGRY